MEISEWPKLLFLDVTARCNARCLICARSNPKWGITPEKDDIEKNVIDASIPFIQHAEVVDLTGYGEFFLSPHAEYLLKICAESKTPVHLTTNGTLLFDNEKLILETIGKFKEIRISIQSHHENIYKTLTGGLDFKKMILGLNKLNEIADHIEISHTINTINAPFLLGFMYFYDSLKLENKLLNVTHTQILHSEQKSLSLVSDKEFSDTLMADAYWFRNKLGYDDSNMILPLKFKDVENRKESPEFKNGCPTHFEQMFISRSGLVKLCSEIVWHDYPINILDYSNPMDVWHNEHFENNRKLFNENNKPAECSKCPNMFYKCKETLDLISPFYEKNINDI